MKQTAVEYLEEKLDNALCDTDYITWQLVCQAVKEAKEIEKQQIEDAFYTEQIDEFGDEVTFEYYYNETFNK